MSERSQIEVLIILNFEPLPTPYQPLDFADR